MALFCVSLGLLGEPGEVIAKGYNGSTLSHSEPTDTRTSQQVIAELSLQYRDCVPPSPADCEARDYAMSRCGRYEAGKALGRIPGTSTCKVGCGDLLYTYDKCSSDDWLNSVCGQMERRIMDGPDPSTSRCWQLISAQNPGLASQPTLPVVVPETQTEGGGSSGGGYETVRRPAYDRSGQVSIGFTTHYFGLRSQDFTFMPQTSNYTQVFTDKRRLWEISGDAVNECHEYLYEKYYDYSQFEDATAALGGDYRAYFEVAYDPGQPAPRSALGSNALAGVPQRQRDGTVNEPQISFPPDEQPKNAFFDLPLQVDERDRLLTEFDPGIYSYTTDRPPSRGIMIVDTGLFDLLRQGQQAPHTYVESWAWHQAREAELSAYLDEELLAYDNLKTEFQILLYRRAEVLRAIDRVWHRIEDDLTLKAELIESSPLFDPGIWEAGLPAGDPFSSYMDVQRVADVQRLASITDLEISDFDIGIEYDPGQQMTTYSGSLNTDNDIGFFGSLSQFASLGLHLLRRESEPQRVPALTGYGGGQSYTAILTAHQAELSRLDGEIEAALVHAQAVGCLDLSGPNPCDWSPKMFAQRMDDPYAQAREGEYQRCMEYTADQGFQYLDRSLRGPFLANNVVTEVDGAACAAVDYRANPTMVERYMDCVDQWRADTVAAVQASVGANIIDPETGLIRIGAGEADSYLLGNDMFYVRMAYEAKWAIAGLSEDYCALQPSLTGHMDITARALFVEKEILRADANVTLESGDRTTAALEINGERIIDPPVDQAWSAEAFNLVDEEDAIEKDIVSAGVTVVVVFIPLRLEGGIAGRLGAGVALGAGSPSFAEHCSNGSLVLEGTVRPFAGLDAFASASIDAIIIEAGIKASLTIIQLEFPFTTQVAFFGALDPSGTAIESVDLNVDTNLDMVLSLLSGRLSAFVEICYIIDCERMEATIFEWDGLRFTSNLFHNNFQVQLGPLLDLQAQQSGG